jgi:allantoinase
LRLLASSQCRLHHPNILSLATMTTLILTSRNVLLPNLKEPVPATIQVDPSTGKITSIELSYTSASQWPSDRYDFVDAGDLYIIPGLVE